MSNGSTWNRIGVSAFLGVSPSKFDTKIRTLPGFPHPLTLGPKCRPLWSVQSIMEWLDEKRKEG